MKLHLPDVEIVTLRVGERSSIAGRSLARIELRRRYELLYWQYAEVHRYFQILAEICDFVMMLCLLSLDHQKISPGQTHYMIRTEEQVDHGE